MASALIVGAFAAVGCGGEPGPGGDPLELGQGVSATQSRPEDAPVNVIRIGRDGDLPDLAAFAGRCVRPGDEIQLEEGRSHYGRLKLRECGDTAGMASGPLVIRSYRAGEARSSAPAAKRTPTWIIPSQRPSAEWERVARPRFRGKVVQHLVGRPVYRVRTLEPVRELYYRMIKLPLAREPSIALGNAAAATYRTIAQLWEYAPDGCQAGYCVRLQKPLEALRRYGFGAEAYAVFRDSPWSKRRIPITWVNPDRGNSFAAGHLVRGAQGQRHVRVDESLRSPWTGGQLMTGPGWGVALYNTLALMDAPGEWYYDPAEKYLYLHFAASSGNPLLVDARPQRKHTLIGIDEDRAGSERWMYQNAAVSFVGRTKGQVTAVEMHNIRVVTSAGGGIRIMRVPRVDLRHVSVYGTNGEGIALSEIGDAVLIQSTRVKSSGTNGIKIYDAPVVELFGNTIENSGLLGHPDSYGMNANGARIMRYARLAVAGNDVANSGCRRAPKTAPMR
jgi:hypothetical protein